MWIGTSVYRKDPTVRRLAIILLLATGPFLPVSAAAGQTTFTLHGGLSRLMLAEILDQSTLLVTRRPIVGVQAGFGASFQLTPPEAIYTFGVRVSGTYAQRGAAHTVRDRRTLVRMHNVLVSVQYDMRFPFLWGRLTTNLTAGPTVGRMLSCNLEIEDVEDEVYDNSPCPEGEFRKLDYGLTLGGGLEWGVTDQMGITAGLQYHWGAIDIGKSADTRILNRTLALQGGLVYHIG